MFFAWVLVLGGIVAYFAFEKPETLLSLLNEPRKE